LRTILSNFPLERVPTKGARFLRFRSWKQVFRADAVVINIE
jgi:hypothetical protein